MAHDFKIKNRRTGKDAWFFGYADALIYKKFKEVNRDAGVSGDGTSTTKTRKVVARALNQIIDSIEHNYPDPNRADDLKSFLKAVVHDDKMTDIYELYFM